MVAVNILVSIMGKYISLICARGGSKGLPGKNIRPFMGRPLIQWAIEKSFAVNRIQRVIVSTDCPEITRSALQSGAEVPFVRPQHLASDDCPEWLVWQHALEFLKADVGACFDGLIVVPATSPLRAVEDLERCLDEFESDSFDFVVTGTQSKRNPYFNMVIEGDGGFDLVCHPTKPVFRRQDAPAIFDLTTVAYVLKPDSLLRYSRIFDGRVGFVEIPEERAIDIDTLMDFELAEIIGQRSSFVDGE
jgi:CMP-N-acetylneuraminic acid synthetase